MTPRLERVYYKLDRNRLVVPVASMHEWGRWFEENPDERIVDQQPVGTYLVSTVFVGIATLYMGRLAWPQLFETMIFATSEWRRHMSVWEARCSTYEEALKQHDEGVGQALAWCRQLPVCT